MRRWAGVFSTTGRTRWWIAAGLAGVVLLGAGTVWTARRLDGVRGHERHRPRSTAGALDRQPWRINLGTAVKAPDVGGPGNNPGDTAVRTPFCSFGEGALYCAERGVKAARIDPADGDVVWSLPAAPPGPDDGIPRAPSLSGGLVQTVSPDGTRLEALDTSTHRTRWSRDISSYGGRVHQVGDTVLLVSADGTVTAVDSADNLERWHHHIAGQPLPTFFSFGDDGHSAYAIDPVRGTTRWRHSLAGNLIPAGTGQDGALQLTETDAQRRTTAVIRYDPATRTERRLPPVTPVTATSVVPRGGRVYLLCDDGGLVAVDTGARKPAAQRWRLETSVSNASALVATEDRLYFSAADGRLLAVDAERGELLGQTPSRTGRGFVELLPAPVAQGGRVFAAAPDGTVFAVDDPLRPAGDRAGRCGAPAERAPHRRPSRAG